MAHVATTRAATHVAAPETATGHRARTWAPRLTAARRWTQATSVTLESVTPAKSTHPTPPIPAHSAARNRKGTWRTSTTMATTPVTPAPPIELKNQAMAVWTHFTAPHRPRAANAAVAGNHFGP